MRGLKKNFNSTNFEKLSIHYFNIFRYLYDLLYNTEVVFTMNLFGNLSKFIQFYRNSKPGVSAAAGGRFHRPCATFHPGAPGEDSPAHRSTSIEPVPGARIRQSARPCESGCRGFGFDILSAPEQLRKIRFLHRACPHENGCGTFESSTGPARMKL